MRASAFACAFAFALACGGPGQGAAKTISLRMIGNPSDARVTVDDQIVGTLDMVKARGVAMPVGKHRVSVEAPGYFPFDVIVEAKSGEKSVEVTAALTKIPD